MDQPVLAVIDDDERQAFVILSRGERSQNVSRRHDRDGVRGVDNGLLLERHADARENRQVEHGVLLNHGVSPAALKADGADQGPVRGREVGGVGERVRVERLEEGGDGHAGAGHGRRARARTGCADGAQQRQRGAQPRYGRGRTGRDLRLVGVSSRLSLRALTMLCSLPYLKPRAVQPRVYYVADEHIHSIRAYTGDIRVYVGDVGVSEAARRATNARRDDTSSLTHARATRTRIVECARPSSYAISLLELTERRQARDLPLTHRQGRPLLGCRRVLARALQDRHQGLRRRSRSLRAALHQKDASSSLVSSGTRPPRAAFACGRGVRQRSGSPGRGERGCHQTSHRPRSHAGARRTSGARGVRPTSS